jgi:hypothetical protein
MTIESWKSIFDVVALVLLFLTFAVGAGGYITGNIINERQAKQLRQFDADLTGAKTDLAKQQERAAKAEIALAKLQSSQAETSGVVHSITDPRKILLTDGMRAGLNKNRGAHILFQADGTDSDSESLLQQFMTVFKLYTPEQRWIFATGMPVVPPFTLPGVHIRHENSKIANNVAAIVGSILKESGIPYDSSVPTGEELKNLNEGKHWLNESDNILIVICRRG